MPDTCTIVANTITCPPSFDWTAVIAAAVGIFGAVLATWMANRHQLKEASKQRQLAAAGEIIRAANNMVRNSHRDLAAFRDSSSDLEIACRTLSVELRPRDDTFVIELVEWSKRLDLECQELGVRDPEPGGEHNSADIVRVRKLNAEYVNYLTDWLAADRRGAFSRSVDRIVGWMPKQRRRRQLAGAMLTERRKEWSDGQELRTWPPLAPGGEGSQLTRHDDRDEGLLFRGEAEGAQDPADRVSNEQSL